MIRLRIGQSWKRERVRPVDGVGLELHGVNVLSGVSEESLLDVLPSLVHALARLVLAGARLAEASFPEARLHLTLERMGSSARLQVIRLTRPAARLRGPVEVELLELAEAVSRSALAFVAELGAHTPELLEDPGIKRMRREASRLQSGKLATAPPRLPSPWAERISPTASPGFHLELRDPTDLLRTFSAEDTGGGTPGSNGDAAALSSLLCEGRVQWELPSRPGAKSRTVWKSDAPPFLTAFELSRQGTDLLRAIEDDDASMEIELAGVRPTLQVDLRRGQLRLAAGERIALEPRALAEALFDVGIGFCAHVRSRNPRQAKNPWLEAIESRCQNGLRQLRGTLVPLSGGPELASSSTRRRRSAVAESPPLAGRSRLRKLHFDQLWEHRGVEEPRALLVRRSGALLIGAERAIAYDRVGQVVLRYTGSRGIAANAAGRVLCASEDRLLAFEPGRESATWLQDHDGLPLDPELSCEDGVLTVLSEARTALAFDAMTGRRLWRVAPPRTQRCVLEVESKRVLIGTDAGDVFALGLRDGQVRFRLRTSLPIRHAPLLRGRRLYAVFSRGDATLLIVGQRESGELLASVELELADPSAPVPYAGGLLLVGTREDSARVVSLSAAGKLRWQRRVHLGPGPYRVQVIDGAPLVHARDGSAARLTSEGRIDWRLGTAGEPLLRTLSPCFARGVLVLPGDTVRAVEPKGGRVLAEVQAGGGLRKLAVDSQLSLYTADEEGHLRVWRLASHLAVVPAPGPKPGGKDVLQHRSSD